LLDLLHKYQSSIYLSLIDFTSDTLPAALFLNKYNSLQMSEIML